MDPLLEIIQGTPAKNLNRAQDLEQNILQVKSEFVGKPQICHELVKTIIYIRRKANMTENTARFYDLWNLYKKTLLTELDTRWLLSVVDTAIDIGDDLEAAVAMNISQCVNQCNIHASLLVNCVDGRFDVNKLSQELKFPTWDGMISVDVPTGDMVHNMMVRMDEVIGTESWLMEILTEIKNRLRTQENWPMNSISRFSRIESQRDFFK